MNLHGGEDRRFLVVSGSINHFTLRISITDPKMTGVRFIEGAFVGDNWNAILAEFERIDRASLHKFRVIEIVLPPLLPPNRVLQAEFVSRLLTVFERADSLSVEVANGVIIQLPPQSARLSALRCPRLPDPVPAFPMLTRLTLDAPIAANAISAIAHEMPLLTHLDITICAITACSGRPGPLPGSLVHLTIRGVRNVQDVASFAGLFPFSITTLVMPDLELTQHDLVGLLSDYPRLSSVSQFHVSAFRYSDVGNVLARVSSRIRTLSVGTDAVDADAVYGFSKANVRAPSGMLTLLLMSPQLNVLQNEVFLREFIASTSIFVDPAHPVVGGSRPPTDAAAEAFGRTIGTLSARGASFVLTLSPEFYKTSSPAHRKDVVHAYHATVSCVYPIDEAIADMLDLPKKLTYMVREVICMANTHGDNMVRVSQLLENARAGRRTQDMVSLTGLINVMANGGRDQYMALAVDYMAGLLDLQAFQMTRDIVGRLINPAASIVGTTAMLRKIKVLSQQGQCNWWRIFPEMLKRRAVLQGLNPSRGAYFEMAAEKTGGEEYNSCHLLARMCNDADPRPAIQQYGIWMTAI